MGCSNSKIDHAESQPERKPRNIAPNRQNAPRTGVAAVPVSTSSVTHTGTHLYSDNRAWQSEPLDPKEERRVLLDWISSFDVKPAHQAARVQSKRIAERPDWFLESEIYQAWLDGTDRLLWLRGPRHTTNYLIFKAIEEIDHTIWRVSNTDLSYAYTYLAHPDTRGCSATTVLRSILLQLLQKTSPLPTAVIELYRQSKAQDVSTNGLLGVLKQVVLEKKHVYLAFDAIDEVSESARSVAALLTHISSMMSNVSLIISTHEESQVDDLLSPYATSMVIDSRIEYNIDAYFRTRLREDKRFGGATPDIRNHIRATLLRQNSGPLYGSSKKFQLVARQLDTIAPSMDATAVRMALQSLPSNLETAYDRILASLESHSGSVLLQVLQWLAHSYLPLKHEEVIDIISTNSEVSAESVAAAYRFITPVLSRFIIYSNNGQMIRLHECAKDYFTSEDILLGPCAHYGFSEADAHATIARCCLKYLMGFGGTRILTPEDKNTNHLLEYAARFWYRHSRAASQLSPHSANARILHEMATEFFGSQNKPSFHNWLRVSRPDHAASNNPRGQDMSNLFGQERLNLFGNSLYYAATCGLTSLVSNFIQAGQSARTEAEHIDGCRYPGPLEAAVEEGYTDIAEILLEADARLNTWTQLGGTCLLRACRQGDVNMAQLLIQYGAKVNAWLSDGSTTLHCAAKYGSADLIDLLVEHGADIDARSNVGTTPLLEALLGGKVDPALALLRKGANIEAATEKSMRTDRGGGLFDLFAITNEQDSEASREIQDSTQRTPLYVAISENNIVVAQELVARGARVDALTSSGATSLFAATHAGLVEMIKFLLQHKASTKVRTHSGATLLHAAAESGKPEVVKLMFAHKIDPTVKDDWQDTALMRAVSRSGVEVVRAFANHGCNLHEIKQVSGMTLLHFAALNGNLDTVAFLLERGLDVHARNLQGGTPLHIAANAGHTEVMELLLRSGADINATFLQNWTPLRAAIMGGAKKAIISLLKQIPPPNLEIKDKEGYTVLQIAVHKGNAEITELLLQNGADPNSQTNEGVTALMTAADNMVRLVPTLLKFGARVDIEVVPGVNALARPVLKDDSALVEMLMEGQKDREALFVALEVNSINGRIIDVNDVETLSWALVEGREVCTWMILRYGSFTPNTPLKFPDAEAAYPPLVIAVQFGHLNIVKLLLRLGVDIGTCTRALYVTASLGRADIAEALLDYGVNVDGYNDSEITPLMSALENRHDDAVRLLCKRGANLAAEEEKLNLSVVIGPKQVFYGIRHQR